MYSLLYATMSIGFLSLGKNAVSDVTSQCLIDLKTVNVLSHLYMFY